MSGYNTERVEAKIASLQEKREPGWWESLQINALRAIEQRLLYRLDPELSTYMPSPWSRRRKIATSLGLAGVFAAGVVIGAAARPSNPSAVTIERNSNLPPTPVITRAELETSENLVQRGAFSISSVGVIIKDTPDGSIVVKQQRLDKLVKDGLNEYLQSTDLPLLFYMTDLSIPDSEAEKRLKDALYQNPNTPMYIHNFLLETGAENGRYQIGIFSIRDAAKRAFDKGAGQPGSGPSISDVVNKQALIAWATQVWNANPRNAGTELPEDLRRKAVESKAIDVSITLRSLDYFNSR